MEMVRFTSQIVAPRGTVERFPRTISVRGGAICTSHTVVLRFIYKVSCGAAEPLDKSNECPLQ
uniref:Uncharacterized protein n=1 Tax=Anguilla anguilla TaxID=7936 RepID=A0A0E9VL71_ANGAN